MGVLAVFVGDDEGLVAGEAKLREQAIGDTFHHRASHCVLWVERDCHVIDWLGDARIGGRGGLHDLCGDGWFGVHEVAGAGPGDTVDGDAGVAVL
jgi:hypothetical protein